MTTPFHKITEHFYAAPQLTLEDIARAKEEGFDTIINNRPDHEEPSQLESNIVATAAAEAGLTYVAIPIDAAGIGPDALNAFDTAMVNATKTLAFCRSGTRSTTLRSFAAARSGENIGQIIDDAAAAGYDLRGHKEVLTALQSEE